MGQDAVRIMPDLSEDDFYRERGNVYEMLYAKRQENKYIFERCLSIVQRRAKELRIPNFMKTWNAYVETMSPKNQSIMGANQTNFPGQPTQLQCGRYSCDETVCYNGRMGEDIEVISHPLLVTKRIINIDSGDELVQLSFDRGRGEPNWRTLTVSNDTVSSAQKIIGLSRKGLAVNSENAKEVVKYISDLVSLNYDELPLQKSTTHLGWLADGQYAPYAEGIEYESDSAGNQNMYNAFVEKGSYDEWLKIAKETRAGRSVPARIALAGAFAAPLVSKFNGLPFILHFYGTSGMGKSVALILSSSVWGEPTVGGAYVKTFGGTKVAMELTAAFLCNMPMYLDELQIISDRKTFDDMIYMLCEGSSKARGAKDGGLQLSKTWSNCVLTTGEMPIVQSNSGGGAAARVIEINYETIPLFEDPIRVSNRLKENYGFAGRKFIDAFREIWSDDQKREELKAVQQGFYSALSKQDIHAKQVLSASILLAADHFATEVLFQDGKALTVEEVAQYLTTNRQVNSNARCYDWLLAVIEANQQHFTKDETNQEVWGFKEGEYVYFNKAVLERLMMQNGYSFRTFVTWAKQKGKIKGDDYDGRNKRLTVRRTGLDEVGKKRQMLYIALKVTFDEMDATEKDVKIGEGKLLEDGSVEVNYDQELPF